MRIRTKLSLIPSVSLLVIVVIITSVVSFSIYRNSQIEISQYRENEMARVKEELSDKVNMAYELVASEYQNATDSKWIEQHYGNRVKNVVEVAVAMLSHYKQQVDSGKMTELEAQEEAKQKIAEMRYDGEAGYVWINDTSKPFAKMIMHPIFPDINGTVLDDKKWNTALGLNKNLFNVAIDLTEKHSKGFIDYRWLKPGPNGSSSKMQPKVSYVSLFEPWGWIVGSGIYVDDAKKAAVESIKNSVSLLRYDDGEGYFFIVNNDLPYPKMVMHPILPELNGKVQNSPKLDLLANNKTEHVFTALVKTTQNSEGAGFVDYIYNKPTKNGVTENYLPKLSYVRSFEPLNWVIGSGVYTDEIDKSIANKEAATKRQIQRLIIIIIFVAMFVLMLSLLVSYLFGVRVSRSLEELTERARDISLGKNLDTEIDSTNRNDEIGQLARAIERLQTSVKMMMQKMKRK